MKRISAPLLALLLVFSLAGCLADGGTTLPSEPTETGGSPSGDSRGSEPRPTGGGSETEPTASVPSQATEGTPPATEPTGGSAGDEGALTIGLMDDAAALGAIGLYGGEYTLKTGLRDPGKALASGAVDAAILPVDEAARIYAETDGKIQIVAVTASGGWGIVERGNTVHTIWDLAQKTVYVPEEDPEALELFTYIAQQYDFIVGDTLNIRAVSAAKLTDYDIALMPAKLVGVTIVNDPATHKALDVGEEWTEVTGAPFLPAGCLVVGQNVTDGELAALLPALRTSQETVSDNLDKAVAMGVSASQEEAWASLECLDFTWIEGADAIREGLSDYFTALFEIDPELIGGFLPDDGFYR